MRNRKSAIALAAAALALMPSAPYEAAAADLSYNYIEIVQDFSRTKNTARGAVGGDAGGRLTAVNASFSLDENLYIRVGMSTEGKQFTNEVAQRGIVFETLDLETTQRFVEVGGGFRFAAGPQTVLFGELIAMDTTVDHDLPCVVDTGGICHKSSSRQWGEIWMKYGTDVQEWAAQLEGLRGPPPPQPPPPQVSKTVGVLEDQGLGLKLGIRHRLGDRIEFESSVRANRIVDETDVGFMAGISYEVIDNLYLGMSLHYIRSTDRNFDNIRKLAFTIRHTFSPE